MEQGSAEWIATRCGKVTASRMADIFAKIASGKPSASRASYEAELVAERLTGAPAENYTSRAMDAGKETEAEACDAYAWETDAEMTLCGFFDHPTIPMSGASPDRLIEPDGLLEMKCSFSAVHLDRLLGKTPPAKHLYQAQWQMACAGRAWCDLVSYDARFPSKMRLHIQRVKRDDTLITEMEREVRAFLAEIDAKVARLTELYERAA